MYLHGFVEPQIHEYDTLSSETRWQESFDCIMANPPFMTPKGGIRPHNKFSITAKRSEVLFVDYIAEHLNPSGRAGIVVPEGIVNTNQNAYKKLRRLLVRDFLVAVVSLPRGIFNPYSNIKTYVLVLDKSFAKKTQDILFLRIDDDGFDLGVQRKPHAFNDIPFAMREFSNYKRAMINGGSFVPQLDSTIILAREAILSNAAACLFAEAYINNQRFASSPDCKWVKLKDIITEARTRVKDRKDVAVLSMTMKHGLIEQAQKFKNDIASKNLCSYKLVKKGQLVIGFPINEGVLAVS
jgi:type I restriction enzyme M protein